VNGLAPIWITGPMAMLMLVAVAAHLLAMRTADMPESRRRIRTANGWLILITVPVLAIAFSMVSPRQPRQFTLIWTVAVAMVGMVIAMAVLDVANNLRLARIQRRRFGRSVSAGLRGPVAADRERRDDR
jgi:uncharacterized BrkB/YihY/UPF0761 family membrane protein